MKIALEDSDVEKIAAAVAAKVAGAAGKASKPGKPGKAKASDSNDESDDDFSGESNDEGNGDDSFGDETGGEEAETPTREDVRDALKLVSKKFDSDTAMEILRKAGGVASLSTLKEPKFAAVIEAAKKKAKAK
jgi:hypothetical protein